MSYVAAVCGKGAEVNQVKEQLLQSNPVLEGRPPCGRGVGVRGPGSGFRGTQSPGGCNRPIRVPALGQCLAQPFVPSRRRSRFNVFNAGLLWGWRGLGGGGTPCVVTPTYIVRPHPLLPLHHQEMPCILIPQMLG